MKTTPAVTNLLALLAVVEVASARSSSGASSVSSKSLLRSNTHNSYDNEGHPFDATLQKLSGITDPTTAGQQVGDGSAGVAESALSVTGGQEVQQVIIFVQACSTAV